MLHARRQRLRQLAEAEASGERFWTSSFDDAARIRLATMVEVVMSDQHYLTRAERTAQIATNVRLEVGEDLAISEAQDLVLSIRSRCPNGLLPTLLEAFVALHPDYVDFINVVLAEHRISYELINGEMVEFESKELHQEVVAPVLRLLSGRPGWDGVETGYQKALREISDGHPDDAITDAGAALQDALKHVGCTGKSLGPLIASARKKGLLAPHDTKLAAGIEKIAEWVSADRSTTGDSHRGASRATRDDAWFTVHVVGALILRLAGDTRGSES